MAIATDEDRQLMADQGFRLIGETFMHLDGRSISVVWVHATDPRRGTFMGALGSPPDRLCMWHAAATRLAENPGSPTQLADWRTIPVGSPCESPIACFVQAEVCQWT